MKEEIDSFNDYLRKQTWDYFQIHASQRLTTFNFYVVISSVITTGIVATYQKDYKFPILGIFLGFMLSFFSFIFWKLDQRNKHLIKNAEAALRSFEDKIEPCNSEEIPSKLKVFSLDEYETRRRKANDTNLIWKKNFSYSDCFNFVFIVFGIIGIIGITASLLN